MAVLDSSRPQAQWRRSADPEVWRSRFQFSHWFRPQKITLLRFASNTKSASEITPKLNTVLRPK
jgi:hypothetical protein